MLARYWVELEIYSFRKLGKEALLSIRLNGAPGRAIYEPFLFLTFSVEERIHRFKIVSKRLQDLFDFSDKEKTALL